MSNSQRRENWLLLLGGLLAAASVLLPVYSHFLSKAQARPSPTLTADPLFRNLGALRQGASAQATFLLKNTSAHPIEITRVSSSCGCTVVKLAQQKLQPGQTVNLEAKLKTAAKRGALHSFVQVFYTSQVDQPRLRSASLLLKLSAYVQPDFEYAPTELRFTENVRQQTIVFRPAAEVGLSIVSAYCTHRAFSPTLLSPHGDGREWEINVAYDPQQGFGPHGSASLVVQTNSKAEPFCTIPLTVILPPSSGSDEAAVLQSEDSPNLSVKASSGETQTKEAIP